MKQGTIGTSCVGLLRRAVDPMSENMELKQALLDRIEQNDRGKLSCKIKSLMAEFGFTASQRVRQASLAEVTRVLDEWGIDHSFPSGTAANDYITMFRAEASASRRSLKASDRPVTEVDAPFDCDLSPLSFVFNVGDALDDARSSALAQDLVAAIWSFRPVCLLIEANDEFFSFAGGYISAILRRRAQMIRGGSWVVSTPQSPEILTVERLHRITGRGDGGDAPDFPSLGAVYLIRDVPDDVQDDELTAAVREMFVPHTYRLKARFEATAGDESATDKRAVEDPRFTTLLAWLSAYASHTLLRYDATEDRLLDLASLFAEASQLRETLLDRQTLLPTDDSFRAGFESTEHMVLKNVVIKHMRRTWPTAEILVETTADTDDPDEVPSEERPRHDKPDVRIQGKVWCEIETFRSIARAGSNPFFELETKLRKKLKGMRESREVWLLIPSDVALLASEQVAAMVRNLRSHDKAVNIRLGFVDIAQGRPVFVTPREHTRPEPRLLGASWREPRKTPVNRPLAWKDVAGYSDLKARLREDVLEPLLRPERYAKYKIGAANGLLLYGLPGCGKSLIGHVLAGEAGLACRRIVPSDLTAMWIGQGVGKIRDLFDWALKQPSCLLVLDEFDAVAPQRQEGNMHTDEKRQVNELLAQLDRIAGRSVLVVATTNYVGGIDGAIRRSGRFDVKIPVFPPNENDRKAIFDYYLGPDRLGNINGIPEIDTTLLAAKATLFTPSDIKTVVETAVRRAIFKARESDMPALATAALEEVLGAHPRSIQREAAEQWLVEASEELGEREPGLAWLKEEIGSAFAD